MPNKSDTMYICTNVCIYFTVGYSFDSKGRADHNCESSNLDKPTVTRTARQVYRQRKVNKQADNKPTSRWHECSELIKAIFNILISKANCRVSFGFWRCNMDCATCNTS